MITENKKNELIDRLHDAINDNDNVCDTAKDCADVAISFTEEILSVLKVIELKNELIVSQQTNHELKIDRSNIITDKNKTICELMDELEKCKHALHGVYNLCHEDTIQHKYIFELVNEFLH